MGEKNGTEILLCYVTICSVFITYFIGPKFTMIFSDLFHATFGGKGLGMLVFVLCLAGVVHYLAQANDHYMQEKKLPNMPPLQSVYQIHHPIPLWYPESEPSSCSPLAAPYPPTHWPVSSDFVLPPSSRDDAHMSSYWPSCPTTCYMPPYWPAFYPSSSPMASHPPSSQASQPYRSSSSEASDPSSTEAYDPSSTSFSKASDPSSTEASDPSSTSSSKASDPSSMEASDPSSTSSSKASNPSSTSSSKASNPSSTSSSSLFSFQPPPPPPGKVTPLTFIVQGHWARMVSDFSPGLEDLRLRNSGDRDIDTKAGRFIKKIKDKLKLEFRKTRKGKKV